MNAGKHLVLVLGMHRSGTSALTKSLEALGVDLGSSFNPATPDNPTGFWEDKNFHALNEEMLKHLHRSWDDLQLVESADVLSDLGGFFPRAKALLNEFLRDKFLAGLKDPRFSLLLPFWKKVAVESEVRVSFVIGFRNPLSVAESLSRRDDFPKIKGLWLWTLHHFYIAAGTTDLPHLVVDYDKMMEAPHSQLDRIARFLRVSPNTTSLKIFCSDFLQPDLRHAFHSTAELQEDQDCNQIVLEIHKHLSVESSDIGPAGQSSWEQAASRWEQSLRPFKGLLQFSSVLGQEKAALKTQAGLREFKLHELLQSLEADHSSVVHKNAQLVQRNTALERVTAQLAQKNTAMGKEAAELDVKIRGMETSLSWKITSPLRYLIRKFIGTAKSRPRGVST